jgi:hypothetical protein
MSVLSFDCGITTLAYCDIQLDLKSIDVYNAILETIKLLDILIAYNEKLINTVQYEPLPFKHDIFKTIFDPKIKVISYCSAANIMNDKKTSELDQIKNLIKLLDTINLLNITDVLIEYQMKSNTTSPLVSYALTAYYISKGCNVHIVHPSKKNKLTFDRPNSSFKYNNKYYSNKKHSEYNLHYLVDNLGINLDLKFKGKKTDIADAVNQAIAWKYVI